MIRYDVEDAIAFVTIDNPEKLNALSQRDMMQLLERWAEVQRDPVVRVAIITASGTKAFSAGGDVSDTETFNTGASVGAQFWADPQHSVLSTLEDDFPIWKPVIAAIDGYCLGGGLTLALGADIRLCTEQSKFGMPEVRIGVNTVTGAALLPRLMNPSLAAYLLLTGLNISATEALQGGLVSTVYTDRTALDEGARSIAEAIVGNAPLAVRAVKEVMRRGRELPLSAVVPFGEALRSLIRASEDYREGIAAVREHRAPQFTGE